MPGLKIWSNYDAYSNHVMSGASYNREGLKIDPGGVRNEC